VLSTFQADIRLLQSALLLRNVIEQLSPPSPIRNARLPPPRHLRTHLIRSSRILLLPTFSQTNQSVLLVPVSSGTASALLSRGLVKAITAPASRVLRVRNRLRKDSSRIKV
jgi:hypothetical protein